MVETKALDRGKLVLVGVLYIIDSNNINIILKQMFITLLLVLLIILIWGVQF